MNKIFYPLLFLTLSMGISSCDKDKDEDDDNNGGSVSTVEFVEFTPPRYEWLGADGGLVANASGSKVVVDGFVTTDRGGKWSHHDIQNYTMVGTSSGERELFISGNTYYLLSEMGWGALTQTASYTTYHIDDAGNVYWHTPVLGGSPVEFNVAKYNSSSFSKISGVPDNLGHNVLGPLPSNQLLIINTAESLFQVYDPVANTFTDHAYTSVSNMQLDLLSIGKDGKVYFAGTGFIEVHEIGVGTEELSLPDSLSASKADNIQASASGELFAEVEGHYLRRNGSGWDHFIPASPHEASDIEYLAVAGDDVYYYIHTNVGEFKNGYVRDDLNGDALMNVPIIAPTTADQGFQTAGGLIYSIGWDDNVLSSYAGETYTETGFTDVQDICQTADGSVWLLTTSSVIRAQEDLTVISELSGIGAFEDLYVQQQSDGTFILVVERKETNSDYSTSYASAIYTSTNGDDWTAEDVWLKNGNLEAVGTDGTFYVRMRDGGYSWTTYTSDMGATWQDWSATNGPNLVTSGGKLLYLDAVGVDSYEVNTWNGSAWETEEMNLDYTDGVYHFVLNGADQIVIQTNSRNMITAKSY